MGPLIPSLPGSCQDQWVYHAYWLRDPDGEILSGANSTSLAIVLSAAIPSAFWMWQGKCQAKRQKLSTAIGRLASWRLNSLEHLGPGVVASTHWSNLKCWKRNCMTVHRHFNSGKRVGILPGDSIHAMRGRHEWSFIWTSIARELYAGSTIPLCNMCAACSLISWLFSTPNHRGGCRMAFVSSRKMKFSIKSVRSALTSLRLKISWRYLDLADWPRLLYQRTQMSWTLGNMLRTSVQHSKP